MGTSQRKVDIMTQPQRQGNMPAPPKTSDTGRLVGTPEVLRQLDTEQHPTTDSDVGIAAEITVNLGVYAYSAIINSSELKAAGSTKALSTI